MDSKKLKEQFDAVVHVDGKKFKVRIFEVLQIIFLYF